MTVKNRKLFILLAVVTLALLNIWRWWPASTSQSGKVEQRSTAFNIEDFEVRAIPADSLLPLTRDIFYPKRIVAKKQLVKAAQNAIQLPPAKSQEELARESAEAEFAKIRCVAVSVRNERIQAYVINAGEPLLVSKGDKVGSRFVVENIVSDGVTLRDPDTGVGGLITVSGK